METTDSIYAIEDLISRKKIHSLRPFNYDPERKSPLTFAQHNE